MKTEALFTAIGYIFQDITLLETALTHRSYSANHNERLEFLGDSLLNCMIAEALYHQFPEAPEGELSRLRSHCVKEEALADVARKLNLGSFLKLGLGELKSGGANRESMLADAVEAVIAAIFLDSQHNFDLCKHCVLHWLKERLHETSHASNSKDAKTQLQEYLQSKKHALPNYEIISTEGQLHEQIFKIRCSVNGLKEESFGTSTNRKKAEQIAASAFLKFFPNV